MMRIIAINVSALVLIVMLGGATAVFAHTAQTFDSATVLKTDTLSSVISADTISRYMTFEQYVLVGSTVRSYLAWLKDTGRLNARFENNMLLWQRI